MGSQRGENLLISWFDGDSPVGIDWSPDVKAGKVFRAYYTVPVGSSLAASASDNLIIQVGATPIQIFGSYSVGGDLDLLTYFGATYTANGTVLTNYNINAMSAHTSDTVLRFNPTISNDGAIIRHQYIPTAKKEGATIPSNRLSLSTMAPANSVILARVTNTSSGAYRYSVEIFWRECTCE